MKICVYFYGKLAYIYAYKKDKDSLFKAIKLIIEGINLMQELDEYDDIEQIKGGIEEINKHDISKTNKPYCKALKTIQNKINM